MLHLSETLAEYWAVHIWQRFGISETLLKTAPTSHGSEKFLNSLESL